MGTEIVAAFVTCPDATVGKQIGQHLVKERLAACCNIIPGVTSIYQWEGKVCEDTEVLLMIKSRLELVPAVTAAVVALHPYDTFEVIAVPIVGGAEAYIKWVLDSTETAA